MPRSGMKVRFGGGLRKKVIVQESRRGVLDTKQGLNVGRGQGGGMGEP